MPENKNFDELIQNIEKASEFCLMCSNPRRLMILCYLLKNERLSVGEIGMYLQDLSQSALSQHLAVLRAKNLVSVTKESQTVYYSIADPAVAKILAVFKETYCKTL